MLVETPTKLLYIYRACKMADTQLRNAVDELLVCAICQDEVNDPKSLLCQHTFCFLCLKAYVKSKDEKRKIMCPTCGQYTELSNGIIQLPKNLFFSQLKDAAKYSKQSKSRTTSDGHLPDSQARCSRGLRPSLAESVLCSTYWGREDDLDI